MSTNIVKDASRLAERHYRSFLDNSPDIVFTVDLDGKFLYVNKTANRITGISVARFLNSSLHKIATPAYKDVVKRFFNNNFKGKSIPLLDELINYNENGNFDRVIALMLGIVQLLQFRNLIVEEAKDKEEEEVPEEQKDFFQRKRFASNMRNRRYIA